MLGRAVGLDQADVKVEIAFGDRCAIVDGERQRVARALRVLDQRPQNGGGREAAERADEGPVVGAGASTPAAVAGGDAGRVVKEVWGFGEHAILRPPSFRGTRSVNSDVQLHI